MSRRDVVEKILEFNKGRESERLRLKYQAIAADPFRFLRGTCHLFAEDWPARSPLDGAPRTWVSGDLHLENFGAYKGDDRIIYFDVNDFDEAALAPCTFELARFATSVVLAGAGLKLEAKKAVDLIKVFLDSYGEALARGKARRVERLVAEGMVRELLDALLKRTRTVLLDRRTELRKGKRTLKIGKRALVAMPEQHRAVTQLVDKYGKDQGKSDFYRVLDVARRVAGTGSLGVERFVVLVEGKGSPDNNYLLDLKEARPTVVAVHVPGEQPKWKSEAERVVTIQDRMEAVSPALLHAVPMAGKGYILKELQPTEDRLDLEQCHGKHEKLDPVMRTMGQIVAWGELRSAGRQGSAIADELVAFAGRGGWAAEVARYSQAYAEIVEADWKDFQKAAADGKVPLPPS